MMYASRPGPVCHLEGTLKLENTPLRRRSNSLPSAVYLVFPAEARMLVTSAHGKGHLSNPNVLLQYPQCPNLNHCLLLHSWCSATAEEEELAYQLSMFSCSEEASAMHQLLAISQAPESYLLGVEDGVLRCEAMGTPAPT